MLGGENPNGDKLERLNEYDSEFGSGLSPNGLVARLTSMIDWLSCRRAPRRVRVRQA
jgi:hypothetical protein